VPAGRNPFREAARRAREAGDEKAAEKLERYAEAFERGAVRSIDELARELRDRFEALVVRSSSPLFVHMVVSDAAEYVPWRVQAREDVETAETDGKRIGVNPRFGGVMDVDDFAALMFHEVMHALLAHPERGVGKDHDIWNDATDIYINELLRSVGIRPPLLNYLGLTRDSLVRWAKEIGYTGEVPTTDEILGELGDEGLYNWIISVMRKTGKRRPPEYPVVSDVAEPGKLGPKGAGEEERRNAPAEARRKLARVAEAVRRAGLSGAAGSLAEMIRAAAIRWDELLRQAFSSVGRQPLSTWLRPSRRLPDEWPGTRWTGVPRVIVLLDVSGSMVYDARVLLGEVYRLMNEYARDVTIVAWSDRINAVIDASVVGPERAVEEVRRHAGGGTVIRPALEYAAREAGPDVAVVVMSDGEIADIDEPEVAELASRIAAVAATAAYIYTVRPNPRVFREPWVRTMYTLRTP